jgi:hypothetical protein
MKWLAVLPFFALMACGTDSLRIKDPQVGDVYQVECKNIDGHDLAYQLLKVKAINGDKMVLMPNRMYYHEKVYCLAAGDYFNKEAAYTIARKEVQKMYDSNAIVDVFRVYEYSCLGNDR